MPRTIDNLGRDVSDRYAEDQQQIDPNFVKGAYTIPSQTQIDVSHPCFPGELESLLQAEPTHLPWALFSAPPSYHEQRKRLFFSQLAPGFGPGSRFEAQSQKILEKLSTMTSQEDTSLEPPAQPSSQSATASAALLPPSPSPSTPAASRSSPSKSPVTLPVEERQEAVVKAVIGAIKTLNKLLFEINGKKNEYTKG